MEIIRRWVPLLLFAAGALGIHYYLVRWLSGVAWFAASDRRRLWLRRSSWLATAWLAAVPVIYSGGLHYYLPATGSQWVLALTMFWCSALAGLAVYVLATRNSRLDTARRAMVRTTATTVAALPLCGGAAGFFIARAGAGLREVDVRVKGLHPDLNGLRIAQLTDIHFGPFLGRRELERAVSIANETRPHLTVVTGDLITRRGDDLEECIQLLRPLRADAGIYGCHGNHEVYARVEDLASTLAARQGFRILRDENELLRFGDARLNLAGVDYQPQGRPYLANAESMVRGGAFNLLLSHNPDVFPRASEAGFHLTLSGHTHGGQVTVEILDEHINVARFFTPYVLGLYEQPGASIYVSPGLGTVGAPVRLGAPPEVTLVRLCAA